jgi:hypothetical protein
MIIFFCLLGFAGLNQAGELEEISNSFYRVPLVSSEEDVKKQEGHRINSLVMKTTPCQAFDKALAKINSNQAHSDDFYHANFALGQQPSVLCSQAKREAPLVFFSRLKDANKKLMTFLAQAENAYFKQDDESLARRHEALYHAVQNEDDCAVLILVENGAPLNRSYDLLSLLTTNCLERIKVGNHISRSSSCYGGCSGPRPVRSEESAYKIAKLLIQRGVLFDAAAKAAKFTGCTGKSCAFLRTYYFSEDLTDRKSNEKNRSQKVLSPLLVTPSSPPQSSSYLGEEDEIEIESDTLQYVNLNDDEDETR